MASIALQDVHKTFGTNPVIRGVDLTIDDREFVVFVGPSGCGKSTMLRLIAGLEEASSGNIVVGDRDVTGLSAAERGLAMVFQSYALYPHKTVAENIAFPLKVTRRSRAEIDDAVRHAADVLRLGELLDRRPKALSGGQRQRVAIGRSIVRDPAAFLFDEPLSNLDAALRVQMRVEIARLHRRLNATMIYVTHDQVEAMTLADRIVVFSAGRIEQVGRPLDLYRNPANLFVATFLGSPQMNILDCRPAADPAPAADGFPVTLADDTVVSTARPTNGDGHPTQLGIRPEHIDLTDPDGGPGTVVGAVGVAERLGGDTFLYVDIDTVGTVVVRADGDCPVAEGEQVGLRFRPEQVHLFGADERAVTGTV